MNEFNFSIQGEAMPTKNLAKRAVALKLCESLHQAGNILYCIFRFIN